MLDEVVAYSGARGRAAHYQLRCLAHKRSQRVGDHHATELCDAYIATMAKDNSVSRTTVRDVWRVLEEAGVFDVVPFHEARARGFKPRWLPAGKTRHGKIVFVSKDVRRRIRCWLGPDSVPPVDLVNGWDLLPRPYDPNRAVPGHRDDGGRPVATLCPRHDDHHPSASVFVNLDGETGGGICHACTNDDGSPFTFATRWNHVDGAWWFKPAVQDDAVDRPRLAGQVSDPVGATAIATIEGGTHAYPGILAAPGAVYDPNPAPTARTAVAVLERGHHDHRYLRSRRFAPGDLLEVLRRADKRAGTDRAVDEGWTAASRVAATPTQRPRIPDRVVFPADMEPTYERVETNGGSYPRLVSLRAIGLRWASFDMDAIDVASVLTPTDMEAVRAEVEATAASDCNLSGRYAGLRSSEGGFQVVMELRGAWRGNVGAVWAHPVVRRWREGIGARLAAAAGGKVRLDIGAGGPGRPMRRPGARWDDRRGMLWMARLFCWSDETDRDRPSCFSAPPVADT